MENLDDLRDKIYKDKYHDYDYDTVLADTVLTDIQNELRQNPELLSFVLKSLINQNLLKNNLYYIVVHKEEHKRPYKESVHGTFENYAKYYINNVREEDYYKWDVIINKVFTSIAEAQDFAKNGGHDDEITFEKYTIKEILD